MNNTATDREKMAEYVADELALRAGDLMSESFPGRGLTAAEQDAILLRALTLLRARVEKP